MAASDAGHVMSEAAFRSGIGRLRVPAALRDGLERVMRSVPIRWRILSIAAVNTLLVLILGAVVFEGARVVSRSWSELRQVRQSERLLAAIENEASRLQGLIHRYINQADPDLLNEIVRRGWTLSGNLTTRAASDPTLSGSVAELVSANEKLLAGFDELRRVQSAIADTYQAAVLRPTRVIAGLYTSIDVSSDRNSPVWSALARSRDAFSAALVAANAYYLSLDPIFSNQAQRNLRVVEQSVPDLTSLAAGDLERQSASAIGEQAAALRTGLGDLAKLFADRTRLLKQDIDGNQAVRSDALDRLTSIVRQRETQAQSRFDEALDEVLSLSAILGLVFVSLSVIGGIAIAASIIRPLRELRRSMHAIVGGDYTRIEGLDAQDEIGEMARAVAVFRENAIARQRAESELRTSKEWAEAALAELHQTQRSLIEAEKLAALGGLVAGVAHEVNNPVGISLTVASSLSRRCEIFAAELQSGQLRRSRLSEFVAGNLDAANQLVANLQRAGELIQAFKQVAVDRSHADRRLFDLREACEQILASLRPGLKKSKVELSLDIPEGIVMDSYPGPLGQVLTNLFLNAATHAFPDGAPGSINIEVKRVGAASVQLSFHDDGRGMTPDVQRRAFDPFFTTRRSQGGTGLGLHIVYNLVTARLGGEIALQSRPNGGTTFRITVPLVAPNEDGSAVNRQTDRRYG
jgi:signal transduction histidine kinase